MWALRQQTHQCVTVSAGANILFHDENAMVRGAVTGSASSFQPISEDQANSKTVFESHATLMLFSW